MSRCVMVAMGNTWRMAASYGTTTVCLKPVRPALCTKWSPCMPCRQFACFAGGFASAEPCCLPSCSASHAASINICRLKLLCCMQHCWLFLLQAGVCGLCRLSLVLHPGESAILRWIKSGESIRPISLASCPAGFAQSEPRMGL